jgi:hypothetical protein
MAQTKLAAPKTAIGKIGSAQIISKKVDSKPHPFDQMSRRAGLSSPRKQSGGK